MTQPRRPQWRMSNAAAWLGGAAVFGLLSGFGFGHATASTRRVTTTPTTTTVTPATTARTSPVSPIVCAGAEHLTPIQSPSFLVGVEEVHARDIAAQFPSAAVTVDSYKQFGDGFSVAAVEAATASGLLVLRGGGDRQPELSVDMSAKWPGTVTVVVAADRPPAEEAARGVYAANTIVVGTRVSGSAEDYSPEWAIEVARLVRGETLCTEGTA